MKKEESIIGDTLLFYTMLKRSALKPKKNYTLKKSVLKPGKNYHGLNKGTCKLNKSNSKLSKENCELKKQSDKAKALWEEARAKCIARDHGKCQVCGQPGTQVHHIHLRSKRKDLLYNLNNLILVCDKHHFHQGMEKYLLETEMIAHSKHMTVEELLKFAESED